MPGFRARYRQPLVGTAEAIQRGMDFLFVGVIVAFFALTWGLAVLGDRLAIGGSAASQEHSR
jgi:hypothetical protein